MSKLKQFCVVELSVPESSVEILGNKYVLEHIKNSVVPGTTPEKLLDWCAKYDTLEWSDVNMEYWKSVCHKDPSTAKSILGTHIVTILSKNSVVKETIRCLN